MFSAFIIEGLSFKPTRAVSNEYIQKNYCTGGQPYYEYLLIHIDDVLVVSHAPTYIIQSIGDQFEIKNNEYRPPTTYLREWWHVLEHGQPEVCHCSS